ncbi:MAG: hypothetical protein ACQERN_08700 [Thermodesulfobacteriota bacterium]
MMTPTAALAKYRVADLLITPENVRLAFLLESPYADEVVHGHPLAGGSGKSMARFLVAKVPAFRHWAPDIPVGCQIRRRGESRLAVMNASNYPLDKTLYCPDDYQANADTIDAWDRIRRNPGANTRHNPDHRVLEAQMVADLTERLHRLPPEALVVACGDVARAIAAKCGFPKKRLYEPKVPHPSRNLWCSAANFGDREDFIATVAGRMGKAGSG